MSKSTNKTTLFEQIQTIPKDYFSFNDIRKISPLGYNSLKVSLSNLVKIGKIQKLTRGYYAKNLPSTNMELFALEYIKPSYLSFEWALGYYGLLSQQSYALTLATTKRGKTVELKGGSDELLVYRHLQKKHFWGFQKKGNILIAEPEKAFLDQAYLSLNGATILDLDEINLNNLNQNKLKKYLKQFADKRLERLIKQI